MEWLDKNKIILNHDNLDEKSNSRLQFQGFTTT